MIPDDVTITVSIAIAGFGALAGYFGRIAQKIEDQRDTIYLKELPGISSSLRSFINAFEIFRETGSFERLGADLTRINDGVREGIFSGNIILYDRALYDRLLEFYKNTERLNTIVDGILKNKDTDKQKKEMDLFSYRYKEGKDYPYGNGLLINVNSTVKSVETIEGMIKEKFDTYRSYSVKLVVLIIIIGLLLGIIEVYKLFLPKG